MTAPPRGAAGTKRYAGMPYPCGAARSGTLRNSISSSPRGPADSSRPPRCAQLTPAEAAGSTGFASCLSLQGRQAGLQLLLLLPPFRHVLNRGGGPEDLACRGPEKEDVDLDRDPRAVFPHGRHRQHLATVSGHAGLHDPGPAFPVPLALPLRDDQVHRFPEHLVGPITEHRLGPGIPETDQSFPIRIEDPDLTFLDDSPVEPFLISGLGHRMFLQEIASRPRRRRPRGSGDAEAPPSWCGPHVPSAEAPRESARRRYDSPRLEVRRRSG